MISEGYGGFLFFLAEIAWMSVIHIEHTQFLFPNRKNDPLETLCSNLGQEFMSSLS